MSTIGATAREENFPAPFLVTFESGLLHLLKDILLLFSQFKVIQAVTPKLLFKNVDDLQKRNCTEKEEEEESMSMDFISCSLTCEHLLYPNAVHAELISAVRFIGLSAVVDQGCVFVS